eukprot:scaffold241219_cov41-Attheya_sp.AAC.1
MPPKKPKVHEDGAQQLPWKKSAARLRLLGDLQDGILSLDAKELPANDAWEQCYKNVPEFALVSFEQFQDRLRDHRQQVVEKNNRSSQVFSIGSPHCGKNNDLEIFHEEGLIPEDKLAVIAADRGYEITNEDDDSN